MQIFPEKYDQLMLSADERSFLRTVERTFSEDDHAYFVLRINPRKKVSSAGKAELFHLLVFHEGIILFYFLENADSSNAIAILNGIMQAQVIRFMESDIKNCLCKSRYLTNERGELQYSVKVCFVLPCLERSAVFRRAPKLQLPESEFLFQEDIQKIREDRAEAIKRLLMPQKTIGDNEDIVNSIFQRLCPEITIPKKVLVEAPEAVSFQDNPLTEADRSVKSYRLDKRQIDIVNRIAPGHQLILACAGSGKSVLLIAKCFKLAALNPTKQFLITCYNKNLCNYYQWAIAQAGFTDRNVKCTTFLGLCNQLLDSNQIAKPHSSTANDEYYRKLFSAAKNALWSKRIKERFFGIFIDEVQIFEPEWYRFCFQLLQSKKPNEYYFTIAGDKSQDIKNRIKSGNAPWQGGGEGYPEYRGKSIAIEINYRNSKPINLAIDRFVSCAKEYGEQIGADLTSDPELFLRGVSVRDGKKPTLIELSQYSNEREVEAIVREIQRLLDLGLSEVDIAVILYNQSYSKLNWIIPGWETRDYHLLGLLKNAFERNDWEPPAVLTSTNSQGETYGSRRGVTITTIEGALGLDFQAVILAGLRPLGAYEGVVTESQFFQGSEEERREKREAYKKYINLIYTGCTRARDELSIVLSAPKGSSVYMDIIRRSIGEET